ncbi:MAG TPA: DUF4440 domain-containing protein [Pyrinomonadaceae bacterium]
MKQLILAMIFVACAAATSGGQPLTRDSKAEQEVEATEREFLDALAQSDRAALERLLAEGFTFIHASGQLDTKKQYIDFAAAGLLGRQRAETERINEPWRIYAGHTAVRQSRAVLSGLPLRNTAVYAKVGERWQLVSLQSTRLPVRPKAAAVDRRLYDSYVGEYEIGGGRSLIVSKEGEILIGRVPLRPKFELIPKSETEFIRHNDEGGYGDEIEFIREADGRVTHAVLRDGDQEIWRAKKVK